MEFRRVLFLSAMMKQSCGSQVAGCRLKSASPSSGPRRATATRQPTTLEMTSAVIVAAGKGARMGPDMDKLFLEVAGRPVVAHTWARFDAAACVVEIVMVVSEQMQADFADLDDM